MTDDQRKADARHQACERTAEAAMGDPVKGVTERAIAAALLARIVAAHPELYGRDA